MNALLRIRPPLQTTDDGSIDRGPLLAEAAISALHSLHEPFSLEIQELKGKTGLYARTSAHSLPLLRTQLHAQYPDAEIEEVADQESESDVLTRDFGLDAPEVYPLKDYTLSTDNLSRRLVDPLASVLSVMDGCRVQVLCTPAHHMRRRALRAFSLVHHGLPHKFHAYGRFVARVRLQTGWRRFWYAPLMLVVGRGKVAEEHPEKLDQPLFFCCVRLTASGPDAVKKLAELTASFRAFTLPQSNGFRLLKVRRKPGKPKSYLLSAREIATLWHCPGPLMGPVAFDWLLSRNVETPLNLPTEGTIIGDAVFRNMKRRFGILQDDRRRHMYIVGKSGNGKSALIANMVYSDIVAGKGIALIDPHGDLVEYVLRCVPKRRSNDVVLLDATDSEFPVSLNILDCPPDQHAATASGIISVFSKLFPDLWSPRASYILRNCILSLLEAGGQSLLGVPRILVDVPYRQAILKKVKDHLVHGFWAEYENWTDRYRNEAIATIQNKVSGLLAMKTLRNILGQKDMKVNFREAMDEGRIILVNLSRGKLHEDVSSFIGSLLVVRIQLATMSRSDMPEEQRKDVSLVVDEFQHVLSDSFAELVSEARKFRVSLLLANQYLGQLSKDGSTNVRDAIFGNAGSLLTFQTSPEDAEVLSTQFEGLVSSKDIINLPKYSAFMRLLVNGQPSKPFSLQTLPPPETQPQNRADIIQRLSRERYCEPREVVEKRIDRWIRNAASSSPARKRRKS